MALILSAQTRPITRGEVLASLPQSGGCADTQERTSHVRGLEARERNRVYDTLQPLFKVGLASTQERRFGRREMKKPNDEGHAAIAMLCLELLAASAISIAAVAFLSA